MIDWIRLSNFRSVLTSDAKLSPSGLTVLIGANGSGKSNFVKALHFIADIASQGLDTAIAAQGGGDGIIPKIIPIKNVPSTTTSIEYTFVLPRPDKYPEGAPAPCITHSLDLGWLSLRHPKVAKESLTFTRVLSAAKAILAGEPHRFRLRRLTEGVQPLSSDLTLKLTAVPQNRTAITFDRSPTSTEIPLILCWLNLLYYAGKESFGQAEFADLMRSVVHDPLKPQGLSRGPISLLEASEPVVFQFIPAFRYLRETLRNLRRYDLHISELRREQPRSNTPVIGVDGSNLPSALKSFRSGDRNLQRIHDTLGSIAPHATRTRVRTLTTGQDYVEYIESRGGRHVESWHSSDGTLRATAVMVALGTHPEGSTAIIEEPERGLHPWALPTLLDHMRRVIRERGISLIVTTHSAQLLEAAEPNEVLVCERSSSAGTTFRTLDQVVPLATLTKGDIGRLWVKGLLGGVPKDE